MPIQYTTQQKRNFTRWLNIYTSRLRDLSDHDMRGLRRTASFLSLSESARERAEWTAINMELSRRGLQIGHPTFG